jgi:hypothetical protein
MAGEERPMFWAVGAVDVKGTPLVFCEIEGHRFMWRADVAVQVAEAIGQQANKAVEKADPPRIVTGGLS